VPELHFHYDDSVDRGEKIEKLLRASGTDLVSSDQDAEPAGETESEGD